MLCSGQHFKTIGELRNKLFAQVPENNSECQGLNIYSCSLMHISFMMTSSNGNIFRVTGHLCEEVPAQRPVTRSFDVFFHLHPNKRLGKQWWDWWFKTPFRPLWRHCNEGPSTVLTISGGQLWNHRPAGRVRMSLKSSKINSFGSDDTI